MNKINDDPRLTAYALGELEGPEQAEIESLMQDCGVARTEVEAIRQTADLLKAEYTGEDGIGLSGPQRQLILDKSRSVRGWKVFRLACAAALLLAVFLFGAAQFLVVQYGAKRGDAHRNADIQLASADSSKTNDVTTFQEVREFNATRKEFLLPVAPSRQGPSTNQVSSSEMKLPDQHAPPLSATPPTPASHSPAADGLSALGYVNTVKSTPMQQTAISSGRRGAADVLRVGAPSRPSMGLKLDTRGHTKGDSVLFCLDTNKDGSNIGDGYSSLNDATRFVDVPRDHDFFAKRTRPSDEAYHAIRDNEFARATDKPLSTFSVDVDTASYANVRRFITQGQIPPPDAVRIEELINYFSYDYTPPTGPDPFSVCVDVAACPWDKAHRLARIGLKGRTLADDRPACNLVFLVDVSGSMEPENKLPLLREAMKMLVRRLRADDRVAIVVYAGSSGLVLPSTSCTEREPILAALDRLQAGGSTNGGEGIQLAYRIAQENFLRGAANRVILATDGDFNVGVTDRGDLIRLVEEKARSGVFLSVLGFGMGNLKDATLEQLADKGNGNYAYIDSLSEARKVLVEQLGGTLVTIAKDVKIQIEFNPAVVGAYRLIGYENRILAAQDFNDDRKDAGDIGAGHTVTALYELVPAGGVQGLPGVDPLKYQSADAPRPQPQTNPTATAKSGEMMTVKLRYKQPDGQTSKLIERPVTDYLSNFEQASDDFRFASAVAAFGMILRASPYKGDATYDTVLDLAGGAMGADSGGYRAEFVDLVRKAKAVTPKAGPPWWSEDKR